MGVAGEATPGVMPGVDAGGIGCGVGAAEVWEGAVIDDGVAVAALGVWEGRATAKIVARNTAPACRGILGKAVSGLACVPSGCPVCNSGPVWGAVVLRPPGVALLANRLLAADGVRVWPADDRMLEGRVVVSGAVPAARLSVMGGNAPGLPPEGICRVICRSAGRRASVLRVISPAAVRIVAVPSRLWLTTVPVMVNARPAWASAAGFSGNEISRACPNCVGSRACNGLAALGVVGGAEVGPLLMPRHPGLSRPPNGAANEFLGDGVNILGGIGARPRHHQRLLLANGLRYSRIAPHRTGHFRCEVEKVLAGT